MTSPPLPAFLRRRLNRKIVPVVRLDGVIAAQGRLGKGLSIQSAGPVLNAAFRWRRGAAVALIVNSPGGAPAQSQLLHDRIRHLAQKHDKKVYAFVEDVAASGGYWLACAADRIHVLPTSLVGSIGVISAGLGFADAIAKLGVERRLYTAGARKSLLDPFLPVKDDDVARLKHIQAGLHDAFKDHVRARRGEVLTGDDDTLFQGDVWLGQPAVDLGLVDGIGETRQVLEADFGADVRLPLVVPRGSRVREWLGLAGNRGSGPASGAWAHELIGAAEERLTWHRYGL